MGTYKYSDEIRQEVARRYADGERTQALVAKFGMSSWTVRQIAREQGVTVHGRGNRYREWTPEQLDDMAQRWKAGETQESLAATFGTGQTIVSRVLRQHGYRKTGDRIKPRGGRVETDEGYVKVYLEPDHPLAAMRPRAGYVPEHRLVMAEAIGRPLLASETVHHKNGDRSDNRLANLELRSGGHGRGVRYRCRCCGSHDIEAVSLAASES